MRPNLHIHTAVNTDNLSSDVRRGVRCEEGQVISDAGDRSLCVAARPLSS